MDIIELENTNAPRHPWELARFEVLLELINECIPPSAEQKLIADIGCGDCFFSLQLLTRRQDIEIIGIDPAYSPEAIIQKNKDWGQPRFHLFNSLDALPFSLKEKKIHLILLLDVVEHVEKDKIFLQQTTQNVNAVPGLKILISVPAFQILFTGRDVFLKHFRRYTRKSINKVTMAAGLIPVRTRYFFFSLLPFRFIQKLAWKTGLQRQQKGIGNWKGGPLISMLFKKYLLFDYQFSKLLGKAGINLPGLSVYCICKKPV